MRGANLYMRETFNRIEQKRSTAIGWNTNTQTRGMLVEAIAKAVREIGTEGGGLDVRCPWLMAELENFVTKPNGKAEASDGHHDDQVIALGIALCTIGGATRFLGERRRMPQWMLEDLASRGDSEGRREHGQWS